MLNFFNPIAVASLFDLIMGMKVGKFQNIFGLNAEFIVLKFVDQPTSS